MLRYDWDLCVRGLLVTNAGFEICDRGSIPSMCQITDEDLGESFTVS